MVSVVVVALLVGAAVATVVVGRTTPGDRSPEAGFARDMSAHHAQAVEMAGIILGAAPSQEIGILAEDIMLSQQAQIGQMQAWLDLWMLPAAGSEAPMTWMGMAGMPMAGMGSQSELRELAQASGVEAERRFLQLMIAHHRGGVGMAEAVLSRSDHQVVRELASAIITSQASEIAQMEQLLDRR
ncbi:DUF305 domain-containing protein [Euzebya sp.]|uniref:DUF305 domain-containing protein n=1 Tax=Euzebya sp. TaxID=1971409 RepID=UPI003518564A